MAPYIDDAKQDELLALPALHRQSQARRRPPATMALKSGLAVILAFLTLTYLVSYQLVTPLDRSPTYRPTANPRLKQAFQSAVDRCAQAQAPAGPPRHFHTRTVSDRFEKGTPDLLVRNATIWTGDKDGQEVLRNYDVHLSKGIIQKVSPSHHHSNRYSDYKNTRVIDAAGRWLTPGLVDMHIHITGLPTPSLDGASDANSIGSNVNPWLRIVDGMNQHDPSFKTSIAGGITSGLVLPGSANSMGGQAYPVKYRQVSTHTPAHRLIDPPRALAQPAAAAPPESNDTGMLRNDSSSSWRHMKMACGENARRVYDITRMDEAWDFRRTFDEASKLKNQQDAFCAKAKSFVDAYGQDAVPLAEADTAFPDDLRLEALVDLLRGKVKLNTHCYTQIDFESFIRHTNEFKFPVSAFHHAHEAYLIPDLLKQAYGGKTPSIAIFSTNANYKLEAYFGSPFAGPILASHNITPIYKSDHPVTESRHILNQAAQAHHFGLSEVDALKSVITAPAESLGLDHRIGFVRQGWDADLVLWNNHPLAIGATPVEVVIDGIPQLGPGAHVPAPFFESSETNSRPAPDAPEGGNFTREIEAVKASYDGIITYDKLPFPTAQAAQAGCALFTNVARIYAVQDGGVVSRPGGAAVVVEKGSITCSGDTCACDSGVTYDLGGRGVLAPGITSYGSDLGLTDIVSESETSDGRTFDALTQASAAVGVPLSRAVDGLHWGGHDLQRARASGVTGAIVMPQSNVFFSGLSVKFDTGATTVLDAGAVRASEVAMHVTLAHAGRAISEQIGLLRSRLAAAPTDEAAWTHVASGQLPLVVTALKADHIAQLLALRDAFPAVRLVISGGTEAHLVARQLADRKVPVILIPQTWPRTWDEKRGLPGPPLTAQTTLSVLRDAGVPVALKIEEAWMAANLLWDATRAALETDGKVSREEALALISTNLDQILGITDKDGQGVVAYDRDPFQYGAKVVAVSGARGTESVLVA